MKKLGAWLIKTSHAIARWWGKLTKGFKCNWNKIIFAVSFKMSDCLSGEKICTCKKWNQEDWETT